MKDCLHVTTDPETRAALMAQAMRGEWVEACQELATLGAKVRAAMQPKPAASLHYKLKIDTSAARAAMDDLGDYLKSADVKLNPLGSPADPVSVARALLRRAVASEDPIERLALIAEARAWVALDR